MPNQFISTSALALAVSTHMDYEGDLTNDQIRIAWKSFVDWVENPSMEGLENAKLLPKDVVAEAPEIIAAVHAHADAIEETMRQSLRFLAAGAGLMSPLSDDDAIDKAVATGITRLNNPTMQAMMDPLHTAKRKAKS